MAGDGPIQPMSMDFEFSASISEGPALNCAYVALVPPSSFCRMPSWSPTSAVPCVRFGKYPIFTVSRPSIFFALAAILALPLSPESASEP